MNPAEPDPAAGGAPLDRVPAEASQPASETPPAATEAFPLPEPEQAPPAQPPAKRQMNPVLELVLILAAALGLWYVTNGWIVKPYRIPSASMEPTLQSGDRVLVNRFIYRFHDPRRGDIIVFHPPGTGDEAIAGAKHRGQRLLHQAHRRAAGRDGGGA